MASRNSTEGADSTPPRSAVRSFYVKDPEIPDSELDRVLELLPLRDPSEHPIAREQLAEVLSEFYTLQHLKKRRASEVIAEDPTAGEQNTRKKARKVAYVELDLGVDQDLRDLVRLEAIMDPARAYADTVSVSAISDELCDVREQNRVLMVYRLGLQLPAPMRIAGIKRRSLKIDQEELVDICNRYLQEIAALRREIEREKSEGTRRSRRPNYPIRNFVFRMYLLWRRFSDKGTSRHGADGQNSGPFHRFVRAGGTLIDPDFNGKQIAKEMHEKLSSLDI